MIVESVKLNNFRNYDSLELEFDKGTNLFYGDNAQGKTNILESVYLCGTTRSHKGSKDREIIHFGEDESHICMRIRKGEIPYRIDMHLKKNKTKGIAINGVPVKKASELVGLGNFVFFSPEDLGIIKNGPSERRRFMDMELCQLDRIYLYHLTNYNKILVQRNKLLKDFAFYPESEPMLDVLDEQLVQFGSVIIRRRIEFAKELKDIIGKIHSGLSGGKEQLTLHYKTVSTVTDPFADPSVIEGQLREHLESHRSAELQSGNCLSGLHKDDLELEINGRSARAFASQGQTRSAALALKFGQRELFFRDTGEYPVLLLDDVLSELDAPRQAFVASHAMGGQSIITCCEERQEFQNSHLILL